MGYSSFDFFNALLAPNPIPAAINNVIPPSIGQSGSNGSQSFSGGAAIEFKGNTTARSNAIDNVISNFLLLSFLSMSTVKIISYSQLI